MPKPVVAVRRCNAEWSDEAIAATVVEAGELVGGWDAAFAGKRKIYVKVNLGTDDMRLHKGRQTALSDPSVVRGTLALIRRYFQGEILLGDATTNARCEDVAEATGVAAVAREFEARIVDLNDGPFFEMVVPGNPRMFRRYRLASVLSDVDGYVSVAKLKSHLSSGATLCVKNLFGMTPVSVYGRPRRYLHAPVRLPRVLADMGLLFQPILNVVDGTIAQNEREWHGPPVEMNLVLVGNNCVATDATGMRIMGMDPERDYPDFPFLFDRNPLKLAAEAGLGPLAVDQIELRGDPVDQFVRPFTVDRTHTIDIQLVREAIADQVEVYLRRRSELLRTVEGRYIALAGGEVIATAASVDEFGGRAQLAQRARGSAAAGVLIKEVVAPEHELELLEIYRDIATSYPRRN